MRILDPRHSMKAAIPTSKAGSPSVACRFALVGWLALILALAWARPGAAQVAPDQVLRSADQVRRLTPEQAEQHLEVRLKAVVTFYDEALYSRFVQDETAGIYLNELTNGPALRARPVGGS